MTWPEIILATIALVVIDNTVLNVVRAWFVDRRMHDENLDHARKLYGLVVRHHAVGTLDGLMVGDECPICAKDGVDLVTLGEKLLS